jgi:hypothetical protein
MTPAKVVGAEGGKNISGAAKKEWRFPALRKLPIAATAQGSPSKHNPGDESGGKTGDSNIVS